MLNFLLILFLALVIALLIVGVIWLHKRLKLVEKAEGIEAVPYPVNEMRVRQLIADALREGGK